MSNNEVMMTVEQVAKILQLKVTTVRKYCREGTIPATKYGNTWRVAPSDVGKFAVQNRQESKDDLNNGLQRFRTT